MASSNDVTEFQRRVLLYVEMHKRVGPSHEHALRMGVPLSNLRLAIQLLRQKRMIALDTTALEESFGLTQRGKDALALP